LNDTSPRRRRQRRPLQEEQPQTEQPALQTVSNAPPEAPAPMVAASASQAAPVEREMSSIERARLRSAELMEHGTDTLDDAIDEFALPPGIEPDGWIYQWRRHTVHGQEDPSYAVQLDMKGWQPVPVSRHPELMPKDYSGSTIIRKGQLLMERPKEIDDRARMLEKRKALDQVRIKEDQLRSAPPGTFEREQQTGSLARIGRKYEPILVPKD